MAAQPKTCRNCGGTEHYSQLVHARGGYGPDLLPIGGFFSSPKFRIVICGECGLTEWFVKSDDLAKVREKFTPYPFDDPAAT